MLRRAKIIKHECGKSTAFLCDSTPEINIVSILHLMVLGSGGAVLRLKLVDGRCRVRFPVSLVDLAVWSFSVFFSKTRANTSQDPLERPHGGYTAYSPRSNKQATGLKIYNHNQHLCKLFMWFCANFSLIISQNDSVWCSLLQKSTEL